MWIKICGIREIASAQIAVQAGADAIGLNFFERSPRVVAPAIAAEIVTALKGAVEPVGVFVNHSVAEVREICHQCGLRTVQLHGDEPPEQVAELSADFRVIRAFRAGPEGLGALARQLATLRGLGTVPWACLVDAQVEGSYGGTGQLAPWEIVRRDYVLAEWPPLILAGGLRPENVAEGVRVVNPWGVDVAGGVEAAVACKDATLVRKFVVNARGISEHR